MVILVYAPDDSTTSSLGSYSVAKFACFQHSSYNLDFPLGYCLRSFGGSSRFPSKSDQMVSDACCALGAVVCGQRLHHETCQSIWRFGVGCPSLNLSSLHMLYVLIDAMWTAWCTCMHAWLLAFHFVWEGPWHWSPVVPKELIAPCRRLWKWWQCGHWSEAGPSSWKVQVLAIIQTHSLFPTEVYGENGSWDLFFLIF